VAQCAILDYLLSVRIATGTSGFSYAAWKGSFYPRDLPARRMLASYASRLPTVEANATFYRMPRPETLAAWRAEVPGGFVFALKAPQRITHVKRLAGAAELTATFLRVAAELGPALGPVLYQLPPSMKKDLGRLEAFLDGLPPGGRTALEFRHASWFGDDVYAALSARGAALCLADTDEASTPLLATGRYGYLRLRRARYDTGDLRQWTERILAQPWEEAFVYFKHEDEARGPAFALAMRDVLGSWDAARGALTAAAPRC
jgi:uncharacterized protein YecE (DUF72 family)